MLRTFFERERLKKRQGETNQSEKGRKFRFRIKIYEILHDISIKIYKIIIFPKLAPQIWVGIPIIFDQNNHFLWRLYPDSHSISVWSGSAIRFLVKLALWSAGGRRLFTR